MSLLVLKHTLLWAAAILIVTLALILREEARRRRPHSGLAGPRRSAARYLERTLARLSRHPATALTLVVTVSVAACICVTLGRGVPQPAVHDEFSYVLAADTFAHWRLTNPTPAGWQHFETFHELMQPTYASKFPPGQGLFLALGRIVAGQGIVGVWLSTGLACGAVTWMLWSWTPRRWAVLGGLLAALNMQVLAWSASYWGGAVALLGGSLVAGAVHRLADAPRPGAAIALGIGLIVLANSRPYEGLVFGLAVLVALSVWLLTHRTSWRRLAVRTGAPVLATLAVGAAWTGYDNYRVTGNPFQMPYELYERQYTASPQLLWQPPHAPPVYRHTVMRKFYMGRALALYRDQHTLRGFAAAAPGKLLAPAGFLRPLILGLPLIALPWLVLRRWWMRAAVVVALVSDAASLAPKAVFLHYYAPMSCLVFLFIVQGMRQLRTWRPDGRPVGLLMMRCLLVVCALSVGNWYVQFAKSGARGWWTRRAAIVANLHAMGGHHLIFVRYRSDHDPNDEWVYNRADLAAARIVWARTMSAQSDHALTRLYPNRTVWQIDADAPNPVLAPLAVQGERAPEANANASEGSRGR